MALGCLVLDDIKLTHQPYTKALGGPAWYQFVFEISKQIGSVEVLAGA